MNDDLLFCSMCGNDLSQTDEYGECPNDGSVFCPYCYELLHSAGCVECAESIEREESSADEEKPDTTSQFSLF